MAAAADMRGVFAAAGLLVASILCGGQGGCGPQRGETGRSSDRVGPVSPGESGQTPSGPVTVSAVERRPDDYVGSATCAECHESIARRYAGHSMSRSIGPAACGDRDADASSQPAIFDVDGRIYEVACRDGATVHVEAQRDAEGWIYRQEVPVRFALGSGARGKTYLVDRGGKLFQSPIGWYAGRQGHALSPGYREDPGLRFERAIGDGCLACHAGRVEHDPARPDRYSEPVFFEAAIGCERCHGPGGRHVAAMRLAGGEPRATEAVDETIVNPSRLDPERREAVCNQCHLVGESVIPRFGRGFFDFRPGDQLDDTVVVLVKKGGDASADRAVSHVEQMHQSRCFMESGGRLGCTSCHDPHGLPDPDARDSFYRERCASCHADDACGLAPSERQAPPASGSCIVCHMPRAASGDVPHTAVTDHRVRKRRPTAGAAAEPPRDGTPDGTGIAVFGNASERVPRRELDRAIGLHLAGMAVARRDPVLGREAIGRLVPDGNDPVATLANDVDALLVVAEMLDAAGEPGMAAACRERVLVVDPRNEAALEGLAIHFQRAGNLEGALRRVERLVDVNPWIAGVHARRAVLLGGLGRWQEGVESADAALALDPTLVQVRRWLVNACTRAGMSERAREEAGRLNRLSTATEEIRSSGPAAGRSRTDEPRDR